MWSSPEAELPNITDGSNRDIGLVPRSGHSARLSASIRPVPDPARPAKAASAQNQE
jgi:hypothetical protein